MIHYYIENLKTIFTVLQQFAPQNNTQFTCNCPILVLNKVYYYYYYYRILSSRLLQATVQLFTTRYCPAVHYRILSSRPLQATALLSTTGYCPIIHYRLLSCCSLQDTVQLSTTGYCPAIHYRILSSCPLLDTVQLSTTGYCLVIHYRREENDMNYDDGGGEDVGEDDVVNGGEIGGIYVDDGGFSS